MKVSEKRQLVVDHLEFWMGKLGLQQWGIELIFQKGGGCEVQTNIPYKQATIYFGLEVEDDELEMYAVHELLHIFLSSYRWWVKKVMNRITPNEAEIFNDIDEGVVDTLARVLVKEAYDE